MYEELIESSGRTDANIILGVVIIKSTREVDSCNSGKGLESDNSFQPHDYLYF